MKKHKQSKHINFSRTRTLLRKGSVQSLSGSLAPNIPIKQYPDTKHFPSHKHLSRTQNNSPVHRSTHHPHAPIKSHANPMVQIYWDVPNMTNCLVVSGDVIMNQDTFWERPCIYSESIKYWQYLHKQYMVIWTIRGEKSFYALHAFIKKYSLPVHGIYYIKQNHKYTVNYSGICEQLKRGKKTPNLIIVEVLKLNPKDHYTMGSFAGKAPVSTLPTKVYFIRIEYQPPGLQTVYKLLQQINQPISSIHPLPIVQNYIHTYKQSLEHQQHKTCKPTMYQNTIDDDEGKIQQRMNKFRKQVVQEIVAIKGKNYQINGFSVHYLVGDAIKRNYQKLYESMRINQTPIDSVHSASLHHIHSTIRVKPPERALPCRMDFYQYVV